MQALSRDGTTVEVGTSAGHKLSPAKPSWYWRMSSAGVAGAFIVTAAIMLIAGISEHSRKQPGYAVLFDLSIAFVTLEILGSSFFTVFDPIRTVTVSFTDSQGAVATATASADGVNGQQRVTVEVPADMATGTGRVKVTAPSGKNRTEREDKWPVAVHRCT